MEKYILNSNFNKKKLMKIYENFLCPYLGKKNRKRGGKNAF